MTEVEDEDGLISGFFSIAAVAGCNCGIIIEGFDWATGKATRWVMGIVLPTTMTLVAAAAGARGRTTGISPTIVDS